LVTLTPPALLKLPSIHFRGAKIWDGLKNIYASVKYVLTYV
jgi:hypothetical protein